LTCRRLVATNGRQAAARAGVFSNFSLNQPKTQSHQRTARQKQFNGRIGSDHPQNRNAALQPADQGLQYVSTFKEPHAHRVRQMRAPNKCDI
jgi:hypothetical protein